MDVVCGVHYSVVGFGTFVGDVYVECVNVTEEA